ncbi:MAG: queuosine precursor transporter [Kiritimatiellae bacterium]|nr:queuosine precursor transporter [Kiritimatiellia bacterium]
MQAIHSLVALALPWRNEIVSLASVPFFFGGLVLFFRLLGKTGLYAWTVLCTVAANIEVLMLVHAFGLDTTLGNVIFASTFLATDILSELCGKRDANRCVLVGIVANLAFIAISQTWFLYSPAPDDWATPSVRTLFAATPRVMLASLVAYAVCEIHDVWAYHAIWRRTASRTGDRRAFLWLRNNGSTLVSQLINVLLFNLLAFAGVYPPAILFQIILAGYAIFVATSILDTPFVYLARRIADRHPALLLR